MRISYSKNFVKQAKKLPAPVQKALIERITLFGINPLHPLLCDHPLKGRHKEYRSINITGDYRALYLLRDDEVIFDQTGTHSQLYG